MKYELGDTVWLKSSNPDAGDAGMTVLLCIDPPAEGVVPAYDLAMVSQDGSNLLTFRMPEFALINAKEHSALVSEYAS